MAIVAFPLLTLQATVGWGPVHPLLTCSFLLGGKEVLHLSRPQSPQASEPLSLSRHQSQYRVSMDSGSLWAQRVTRMLLQDAGVSKDTPDSCSTFAPPEGPCASVGAPGMPTPRWLWRTHLGQLW